MTRVDFYVLPDAGPRDPALFACRLAEKAYALSNRIYLLVDSPAEAERLDEMLWTFRDGSFVPHEIDGRDDDPRAAVLIGTDPGHAAHTDLLINVTAGVPPAYGRYQRVAEIVAPEPQARSRGRERFRYYREQGCRIETHNL